MHLQKAQSAVRRISSTPVLKHRDTKDGLDFSYQPMSVERERTATEPIPEDATVEAPGGLLGVLASSKVLTMMLLFLPLGFAAQWFQQPAAVIFTTNFLGIVPLAWLIGKSTEDLAIVTGEVVGGILNATFGNVVEMLLCIATIRSGQLVITKCTLLGSIMSNLLLVMGCSCLFGGLRHKTQRFTEAGANVQVVMLMLSVFALALPTAYAETMEDVDVHVPNAVLAMSRCLAVLLLISYVLYLYFQIWTHASLFGESTGEEEQPDMGPWTAAAVLAACTVLCAAATEFVTGAISGTVEAWGLTQEFVGIILLPIIGNACEHYTAISVALVDKMDLALGVAVGSSCQMALLVAPFTVLVGWACGQDMSLDFHLFQMVVIFGGVLVVASVLWSRSTHWLYGAMMVIAYIAVGAVYFFESPGTSTFYDRTGSSVRSAGG